MARRHPKLFMLSTLIFAVYCTSLLSEEPAKNPGNTPAAQSEIDGDWVEMAFSQNGMPLEDRGRKL